LSYHYCLCQDEAEKAFEFTMKAADVVICQCQFDDGLSLLKKAEKVSSTSSHVQTLLESVRIDDKAKVTKFFHAAMFMSKDVSRIHQMYTAMEKKLQRRLDALVGENAPPVGSSVAVTTLIQATPYKSQYAEDGESVPNAANSGDVVVKASSPCCLIC